MKQLALIYLLVALLSTYTLSMTPNEHLIAAIENNDLYGAKIALNAGADINFYTNKYNVPPLVLACSKHKNPNMTLIEFLLNNGALVNGTGRNGSTALHWASTDKVAKMLLSHKANSNAQDINGNTPLHKAALYNSFKRVRLLLIRGAKPLIKNKEYKTVFNVLEDEFSYKDQELSQERQIQLKEMYILLQTSLSSNDLLIKAIYDNNTKLITQLLKLGVRSDSKDNSYSAPPLLIAIQSQATKALIELLLSTGANPNSQDHNGTTCLHKAYDPAIVALLLKNGAFSNARNKNNETPLHIICSANRENTQLETAALLLQAGALVNAQDKNGNTPLHLTKDTDIVQLLLDYGAYVPIQNNQGNTPLHQALEDGPVKKIKILLKAGTSIFIKNKVGLSCLDKARLILQKTNYKDPYYKKTLLSILEVDKKHEDDTTLDMCKAQSNLWVYS